MVFDICVLNIFFVLPKSRTDEKQLTSRLNFFAPTAVYFGGISIDTMLQSRRLAFFHFCAVPPIYVLHVQPLSKQNQPPHDLFSAMVTRHQCA